MGTFGLVFKKAMRNYGGMMGTSKDLDLEGTAESMVGHENVWYVNLGVLTPTFDVNPPG